MRLLKASIKFVLMLLLLVVLMLLLLLLLLLMSLLWPCLLLPITLYFVVVNNGLTKANGVPGNTKIP